MDKRITIALTLLMNACAGASAFELVASGSTAAKLTAFGAWLISNALALFGVPVTAKKPDAVQP